MNSQVTGLRVAGTIFGIVCIVQLVRLLASLEVVIAGYSIPLWLSAIAAVVTGALSIWLWRLSCASANH